jgi:hypothetical protein
MSLDKRFFRPLSFLSIFAANPTNRRGVLRLSFWLLLGGTR